MSPTRDEFDLTKAEAFAGRVLTTLNDGALCLMISIGHRTGLFDALRTLPPTTSAEIATHAGLQERYVREWLGAMVSAGVVMVDPVSTRFSLPAEHAAALTRAAGADNLATFAQYIALLGGVEDDVVACFRQGGGVPYARYPRFQAVMAEDSGQSVLGALEAHILPLVPGLTARLAGGIAVLDVGCGRGRILQRLAALYPHSRFLGLDLSAEAIATAQEEATRAGQRNLSFVSTDLSDFDRTAAPKAFDLITTFDAVHDQAQPPRVLRGIQRALTPEGVYLMQEIRAASHVAGNIGHPLGPFLYTISCMHCMTVSLAQGGEGLGAMWGEEKTRDYLRAGRHGLEPGKDDSKSPAERNAYHSKRDALAAHLEAQGHKALCPTRGRREGRGVQSAQSGHSLRSGGARAGAAPTGCPAIAPARDRGRPGPAHGPAPGDAAREPAYGRARVGGHQQPRLCQSLRVPMTMLPARMLSATCPAEGQTGLRVLRSARAVASAPCMNCSLPLICQKKYPKV